MGYNDEMLFISFHIFVCGTDMLQQGYNSMHPLYFTPVILTMDDLPVLVTKLKDVAGKWNPLGVQLNFTPGTLSGFPPAVQADPIRALQELLTRWLERINPPPTLESLAEAVGGPVIGNELLARTLLQQKAGFPSLLAERTGIATY